MRKFLDKLNIRLDDNQKWLCLSMFLCGLIGTYISPTINKNIITELPAEWLAIDSLVSAISILLAGMVWKGKFRQWVCNLFIWFCCLESVIAFLLGMYLTFVDYNVWIFAISSLIYSSIISIFVSKCIMTFKPKLWKDDGREIYDNNVSIIGGITCVLGFSTSIIFLPSLKVSIFLWGVTCLVDNIAWMYVYYKNREILSI